MRGRSGTVPAAVAALAAGWLWSWRAKTYGQLHPELRSPWLRLRTPSSSPLVVKAMRLAGSRTPGAPPEDVERRLVPGPDGAPDVPLFLYRPARSPEVTPALLFIHGGGFMIGSAAMFHETCRRFANELGALVVSVDYRLAPETPFPGPLEDCYRALCWMATNAGALGIDPERIAVTGESAGGGLAASLAQLAHDRGGASIAFQSLAYPMLDDRTALTRDHEGRGEFVWNAGSNRLAWTAYLGHPPVPGNAPAYAAAARRDDLSGLPPAWIGVGTLDLLYPEARAYARRLVDAGVPCELYDVRGAYHGFDGFRPEASVSRAFRQRQVAALRQGLGLALSQCGDP